MSAITPEFPPKAAFRKWLRSLPADEVVAERGWTCRSCPLAEWLCRQMLAEAPEINAVSWRPDDEAATTGLPTWAEEFVGRIDTAWTGPVTAADCLRVLARTPRA